MRTTRATAATAMLSLAFLAEPAFARERAERIEPAPSMNDPAGIIEAAMKAAGLSPGGSRKGLGIDPAAVIAAALKAAGLKR